jgi:hypothetical protein
MDPNFLFYQGSDSSLKTRVRLKEWFSQTEEGISIKIIKIVWKAYVPQN